MNNFPTINELLVFLKSNLKIIFYTIASFLIIFGLGIGYTIYSDNKLEVDVTENVEDSVLLETVNKKIASGEQLKPEEIKILTKKLQGNGVGFSFYIEKDSADPFQSARLLKEFFVSPEIIQEIKKQSKIDIEPSPEIAVNVDLNPENLVMTILVGTGDLVENKKIANAYFKLLSEENNSFFDNKNIYIISKPTVIDEQTNGNLIDTEGSLSITNDFSLKRLLILFILVTLMGTFLGIVISIFRFFVKKEVTEIYNFAIKDDDVILNISNLKNNTDEETSKQIIHAVMHPFKKYKVILSEASLNESILEKLKDKPNFKHDEFNSSLNDNKPTIFVGTTITDINPKINIDEIVLICQKNKTTKNWYEKQRKLLSIYKSTVKVILI